MGLGNLGIALGAAVEQQSKLNADKRAEEALALQKAGDLRSQQMHNAQIGEINRKIEQDKAYGKLMEEAAPVFAGNWQDHAKYLQNQYDNDVGSFKDGAKAEVTFGKNKAGKDTVFVNRYKMNEDGTKEAIDTNELSPDDVTRGAIRHFHGRAMAIGPEYAKEAINWFSKDADNAVSRALKEREVGAKEREVGVHEKVAENTKDYHDKSLKIQAQHAVNAGAGLALREKAAQREEDEAAYLKGERADKKWLLDRYESLPDSDPEKSKTRRMLISRFQVDPAGSTAKPLDVKVTTNGSAIINDPTTRTVTEVPTRGMGEDIPDGKRVLYGSQTPGLSSRKDAPLTTSRTGAPKVLLDGKPVSYEDIPSGSTYTGPDGKLRVKR